MRIQYINQDEFKIVLEDWINIFKKNPIDYLWKTKCKRMVFGPGFTIRPTDFKDSYVRLSIRISYDIYFENAFFYIDENGLTKFEEDFSNMLSNIILIVDRNKRSFELITPDRVDVSSHRIVELKQVNRRYSDIIHSCKEKIKNNIDIDGNLDRIQKCSEIIGSNGNKIMNIRSTLRKIKLKRNS